MKTAHVTLLTIVLCLISQPGAPAQEVSWKASGKNGVVAAGHADSVAAGVSILDAGGRAADAAAATILALAVTDYGSFSIGGEVPVLVFDANSKQVKTLSGVGVAPQDPAAIEWFYQHGIPATGSMKAAPTPGAVDLVVTLLKLYGTISFEQAVAPTLELLDNGKEDWHPRLAVTLRKLIEAERNAPGTRKDKLKAARDRFYKGDVSDELEAWYIATGAFLRKSDLAAQTTLVEDPVTIEYRGYTVCKCGPWTQGPVLCQNLRLLEGFDLHAMQHLSADYIHVLTEAMKLGYADRDEYYADSRFSSVPIAELLSDDYTNIRRPLIDMQHASMDRRLGDPIRMKPLRTETAPANQTENIPKQDTTTCVVADRWGNVIAATPSCNMLTNTPGPSGVNTGNRVRSMNTTPGHPNRVEAGKRPRITLTPTLVLKDGLPVIAVSVAGGDLQDQTTLNVLLNHIEFDMQPQEAVTAPRFYMNHHQDSFNPDPDRNVAFVGRGELKVHEEIPESVRKELSNRGHLLQTVTTSIGHPVMIHVDQQTGVMYAAGDPKANRHAGAAK
ncbi:MAG: gamma-glutamyltransferase [Planctomycetota bacterium]|nr:gamma-glutamyltransferase [Planctomycetota bacterium]